jgi:hypothetical protein
MRFALVNHGSILVPIVHYGHPTKPMCQEKIRNQQVVAWRRLATGSLRSTDHAKIALAAGNSVGGMPRELPAIGNAASLESVAFRRVGLNLLQIC